MKLQVPQFGNLFEYGKGIQGLLTMKAPLMKLLEEHAFEKKVHDKIPTESQFR